jgi:ABC-2 type transport system ATP-binding protein
MPVPAIRTEDLTKHFGRVAALEGVSLEVGRGEVFGFLGANGAGKTTTIRLLLDLLRPTRGRAFLNGYDCRRESLEARASVGFLPGEVPIYPDLTVDQLLRFVARLLPASDRTWLETLLHRFELGAAERSRRLVYLSHGTKQKVGLVQALMGRPPVLVLDEPTTGLDPLMIEAFCDTILELRRDGNTVFLSSHVLSEVERLCDRIALVRKGRLVRVASIQQIRREFPRRVTVVFSRPTSAPPALAGAKTLRASEREWRLEIHGELRPLLEALAGLPVADLQVENFRLEDYLLDVYGAEPAAPVPAGTGERT